MKEHCALAAVVRQENCASDELPSLPGFDLVRPVPLRLLGKEEINTLPLCRYEGAVTIVNSASGLDEAMERLEGETLLGFDTETRPVFKKGPTNPPALLQLSAPDCTFLFQLRSLSLPRPLLKLLSRPDVTKTGLGIRDDVRGLQRLASFEPGGFVDVAELAGRLGLLNAGLRSLAATLLGVRISKMAQCSNWEMERLKVQQIVYAATDAWISREIHLHLSQMLRTTSSESASRSSLSRV